MEDVFGEHFTRAHMRKKESITERVAGPSSVSASV